MLSRKRVKIILIICLVAIIFLSIIRFLLFHNFKQTEVIFQRNNCPVFRESINNDIMKYYRPPCLNKWIHRDRHFVQEYMKTILSPRGLFLSSNNSHSPAVCHSSFFYVSPNSLIHHIPHFSEVYFNFFSFVLWQHDVFQTPWSQTCIKNLLIHDDCYRFWNAPESRHGWIKSLVQMVENHWGIQTIISTSCLSKKANADAKKVKLKVLAREVDWFIHPSDAYLMRSLVLSRSPCELAGAAKQLLKKPIEIMVLGRKSTRRLLNPQNVLMHLLEYIESHNNNKKLVPLYLANVRSINHPITTYINPGRVDDPMFVTEILNNHLIFFEKTTFQEQAQMISEIDILLTVHGAGETNLIFMKPCSVVIELFPFGFDFSDYFGSLAKKSGILHYYWQEPFNRTVHRKNYKIRPYCNEVMNSYLQGEYVNNSLIPSSQVMNESMIAMYSNVNCIATRNCRFCSREADGVYVNIPKFIEVLSRAIIDRQHCIRTHPLYNS